MAAPPTLGEFEHIVLLAILRLGENAYGVTLRQEIQERTDRHPSPGALYITVDRLENKGFVSSRFGDPTPQRGGRAKRFFRALAYKQSGGTISCCHVSCFYSQEFLVL